MTVSMRATNWTPCASVGGEAARARVARCSRDPSIVMRLVRTWPSRFATARADAMGFARDDDFESIVRDYAKEYVR
jgi:D-erythronate 2-dehydrogenase